MWAWAKQTIADITFNLRSSSLAALSVLVEPLDLALQRGLGFAELLGQRLLLLALILLILLALPLFFILTMASQ